MSMVHLINILMIINLTGEWWPANGKGLCLANLAGDTGQGNDFSYETYTGCLQEADTRVIH